MPQEKMLTIGILAHVDAGKTSLTECLLYTADATKDRGSVDKGSAITVEQAMDYGIKFSATTSGNGRLKLILDGYQKTTTSEEKIRAYKGVSPLDETQWILHNRGAFKAEDRRR